MTFRSSRNALKFQIMDFNKFPMAVQPHIFRSMDIKSFFKTAITSKKMLELARSCRKKSWNVVLCENHTHSRYRVAFKSSVASGRRATLSVDTFKLIFDHSTVSSIQITNAAIPEGINVRCWELEVMDRDLSVPILKRHRPSGNHTMIRCISLENTELREVVESLNEYVNALVILGSIAQREYLDLRVPMMMLSLSRTSGLCPDAYAQIVVEEWLRDERQVLKIYIGSDRALAASVQLTFFEQYPKRFISKAKPTKLDETIYDIRRYDGEVLTATRNTRGWRIESLENTWLHQFDQGPIGRFIRADSSRNFS